ncbi:MAG: CoB--CoM heterodisulfide reductase iron-sulfur subunit B family protein [Helicobacteraceae bacterium]|nr:CoB--CoM heterodisulfide reductase iron-sulfur subunit B family protein [Helicobacteraceae bacterium]
MKYALFMGCTPYGAAPELAKSLRAVSDRLNIELAELKDASCCGAAHLQDYDDFLALMLNARNLCCAQNLGLEMVTICNTCQLILSNAADRLKNDKPLLDQVNGKLEQIGLRYDADTKVRHFLYVLRDDLGFANIPVSNALEGWRIAPFYGCHNLRGAAVNGDNGFNPSSLDDLIAALGGARVDYERKNGCCGFHTEIQAPLTTYRLSGEILTGAGDCGADMIVTPCPLCQLSLDAKQDSAAKAARQPVKIPVLHLTQMIGLAMGIDQKELGLDHNIVRLPTL